MARSENPIKSKPRAMAANQFWVSASPKQAEADRPGGEAYGSGDSSTTPRKAPAFKTFLSAGPNSRIGSLTSDHYVSSHKPAMTQRAVLDKFEKALRDEDITPVRQAIAAGRKMSREAYDTSSDVSDWVLVGRNEGEAEAMRAIVDAVLEQYPADVAPKMEKRSFPLQVDGRKTEISYEEAKRNERPLPHSVAEVDKAALLESIQEMRSAIEPKSIGVVVEKGIEDAVISKIVSGLPTGQAVTLTMTDAELKRFAASHQKLHPQDKRPLARMASSDKEIGAQDGIVAIFDGSETSRSANRIVKTAQRGSLVGVFDKNGSKLDRLTLSSELEPFHLTKTQAMRQGTIPAFDVPLNSPEAAVALDMIRRNRAAGITKTTLSEEAKDAILAMEGADGMSLNEGVSEAMRLDGKLGLSNSDREILRNEDALHQARLSFTSMQEQLKEHNVSLIGKDQMPVGLSTQDGPRYLYAKGDISFGATAGRVVGVMSDDVSNPGAAAERDAILNDMRETLSEDGAIIAEVEGLGHSTGAAGRKILILGRGHAAGTEEEIQRADQVSDAGGVVYSTMPPESKFVGYAQRMEAQSTKHFAEAGVTSRSVSREEFKKNLAEEEKASGTLEKEAQLVTQALRKEADRISEERALAVSGKPKGFEATVLKRAHEAGISPVEAFERINAQRVGLDLEDYRTAQADRQFALSHVDPQNRKAFQANVEDRAQKAGLNVAEAWEKVAIQKSGLDANDFAKARIERQQQHEQIKAKAYSNRAAAMGISVDELKSRVEETRRVEHIPAEAPAPKTARDVAHLEVIVESQEQGKALPSVEESRFGSAVRVAKSGLDREMVKTAFAQIAHHKMNDLISNANEALDAGKPVSKEVLSGLLGESGKQMRGEEGLPKSPAAVRAMVEQVGETNKFLAARANRRATQGADYDKAKEFALNSVEASGTTAFSMFRKLETEDRAATSHKRLESVYGASGKTVQKKVASTATPESMASAARDLASISNQLIIGSATSKSRNIGAAVSEMISKDARPIMLRAAAQDKAFDGNKRLLESRGTKALEKIGTAADDITRLDASKLGDSRLVIDAGANPRKAAKQISAMMRGEQVINHKREKEESLHEYL